VGSRAPAGGCAASRGHARRREGGRELSCRGCSSHFVVRWVVGAEDGVVTNVGEASAAVAVAREWRSVYRELVEAGTCVCGTRVLEYGDVWPRPRN
jgi:hypothetical protein